MYDIRRFDGASNNAEVEFNQYSIKSGLIADLPHTHLFMFHCQFTDASPINMAKHIDWEKWVGNENKKPYRFRTHCLLLFLFCSTSINCACVLMLHWTNEKEKKTNPKTQDLTFNGSNYTKHGLQTPSLPLTTIFKLYNNNNELIVI